MIVSFQACKEAGMEVKKHTAKRHNFFLKKLLESGKIYDTFRKGRSNGGRARSLPSDFANGVTNIGNRVTKIIISYAFFKLILSIK